MTSTDIVSYNDHASVVAKLRSLAENADKLDPNEVSIQIAMKLASAETVADLLDMADSGATGGRDIVGRPFIVTDRVRWQASSIKSDGPTFEHFAIVPVRLLDTDTEDVITCGGMNVVIALLKLEDFGAIPGEDWIFQFISKDTASGFDTLKIGDGSALPGAQAFVKARAKAAK